MKIEPREGFDWERVVWDSPNAAPSEFCSYCGGMFEADEVPLRLWSEQSYAAAFCDHCQHEWWGLRL